MPRRLRTIGEGFPLFGDLGERYYEWRRGDPRLEGRLTQEGEHQMQRQFTIELRVDYADQNKNTAMRVAAAKAARHIYAVASLLAEGMKPQIAVFSDDYFQGYEEISLLEDTIATGEEMLDAPNASADITDTPQDTAPSMEQAVLDALK